MNIGILDLGVIGRSLALNFERNGYSVAGYDLHFSFDPSLFKDKNIKVFDSLEELVHALGKPRCILMMVPAGKPVDKAIVSIKPYLENLLLDNVFRHVIVKSQSAWRNVVKVALDLEIPRMATSASLMYLDAYRAEKLPANLIQAQRDFFGAHMYHRVDKEGMFHIQWE